MPRERITTAPSSGASRVTVAPTEALSGNRTISPAEIDQWQAFIFNPGSTSRDVTLPPAGNCVGVMVFIGNLGTTTGTLVVKNSAGTAIATIGATAANDVSGAFFFCDGANWFGALGA